MSLLQPIPLPVQNSAIGMHTLKGIVHIATVLTESYERFWNLKPEVNALLGFTDRTPEAIVADLNADYELANERNVKHYEMATTVNQWLSDAGHPMRVPITMPDGYSNDGIYFSYTAPVAPVVDEYVPTPEPAQLVIEEQPAVEEQKAE